MAVAFWNLCVSYKSKFSVIVYICMLLTWKYLKIKELCMELHFSAISLWKLRGLIWLWLLKLYVTVLCLDFRNIIFECIFKLFVVFVFLFLALEFEVHISQNVSPDVLLEHCVPSSFLDASDSFTSSSDNVATSIQKVNNVINSAVLEEQVKQQSQSVFQRENLMY